MKKFKSLLGIGVLMFSLTGCLGEYDPGQQIGHTHTYSSEWSYDDEYHWHQATCEHKDLVSEKAKHSFVMRETDPTYDADGVKTYTCSVCGYSYSEKGKDKLEHNYSSSYSHDSDHHWRACIDEGYEDLYTDYGEHSFSDTRVEPTYDTKGSVTHTCSCGYSYTEELDVLTHHYSDEWSTDGTYHWHACIDEGYEDLYTEKARHTYSDYVYKTYPTDTTPGTKERYCTVCGCVEEATFEAISSSKYRVYEGEDYCSIFGNEQYVYDDVIVIPSYINNKPVTSINGFWYASVDVLIIPDTVEIIGSGAFYYCNGLEKVYIPSSVKEIQLNEGVYPGYMFYGSKAEFFVDPNNQYFASENGSLYTKDFKTLLVAGHTYSDLKIKDGTEHIADNAGRLTGTQSLRTVHIPSSVKDIGEGAFSNCYELEEVTFDEGVQSIGKNAFGYCYKLYSISLPDSVKTLGDGVFHDCKFKEFRFPKDIESIGEEVLHNVPIETMTLDSNNKYFIINNNVLYSKDYSRLLKVNPTYSGEFVVRDEVTTVDKNSFYNCTNITSLTIGKNVTELKEAGFTSCASLETVNWNVIEGNNKFRALKNVNFGKDVKVLPSGLLIGEINITLYDSFENDISDMFKECTIKNLNSVNGLNYIGNSEEPYMILVSADENITTASIQDGCKYVVSSVFKGNTSLTSTTIPASVKKVGTHLYNGCTSLNTVTMMPGNLTTLPISMFASCTSLSSIVVAEGIKNIDDYAFSSCKSLASIQLPNSLERIETHAFYNCAFAQLTLPVNLSYMDGDAIAWCPNLSTLYWNCKNLNTRLLGEAYKPTTKLTRVVFGETVEVIRGMTFESASGITTLEFSNGDSILTIESDACFGLYNSLSTIVFGSSVNTICCDAFRSCKVDSIVLAEGVERLESQAFYSNYGLTSAVLPKSIKYLGKSIFNGEFISKLTYLGTIEEWEQIEKEGNIIGHKTKDHYYLACSDGAIEIF